MKKAVANLGAKELESTSSKANERMRRASVLVAELGPIEKEIAREYADVELRLGSKGERAAQLRAEILALYADAPAAIPFVAESDRYVGTISVQSNVTEITDKSRVYKILGRDKFLQVASITLGVLRKELTAEQLGACARTARTGPRSLVVLEKGAHAA